MASCRIAGTRFKGREGHQGFVRSGWAAVAGPSQVETRFYDRVVNGYGRRAHPEAAGGDFAGDVAADDAEQFFESIEFVDADIHNKVTLRWHDIVRFIIGVYH